MARGRCVLTGTPWDRRINSEQQDAVPEHIASTAGARSVAGRYPPDAGDKALVAALCEGSEAAFNALVEEYHTTMVRIASRFVCGTAAAEDVVQDVWLIVIRQIDTFREHCSLKTWIFRILANRAKTAGQREARNMPISMVPTSSGEAREPRSGPEDSVLMKDTMNAVVEAIRELPLNQRQVLSLRDVDGCSAIEVCGLLELTEGNQRVLLHRARSKVRARMQDYHDRVENDDAA